MLLSGVLPLLELSLAWDCLASCCRPRLEPSHGKLPSQTQQLQGTQAREAREAERIVLSVLESAPVPAGPQFSKSQFLTASSEPLVPDHQGLEKPAPAEASTSRPKLMLTFLPQPVWVFWCFVFATLGVFPCTVLSAWMLCTCYFCDTCCPLGSPPGPACPLYCHFCQVPLLLGARSCSSVPAPLPALLAPTTQPWSLGLLPSLQPLPCANSDFL